MTARDLQYAVIRCRRGLMVINKIPLRWCECDVLEITSSLLWHEFEVKLSRNDFTADFRKKVYSSGKGMISKHDILQDKSGQGPNYFHFVVPEGLIPVEVVPHYAGLWELSGRILRMKKRPTRLHSIKFDSERLLNIAWKRMPNYDPKLVYGIHDENSND